MMIFDSVNNCPNALLGRFIYFDGQLESIFQYDITVVKSLVETEIRYDQNGQEYKVPLFPIGVFPVKVVGVHEPCTLYTWVQVDEVHGHIVLNSDAAAVEYAKTQQCEYAEFSK